MQFRSVYAENKKLILLDQTVLPEQFIYNSYTDYRDVIEAIKRLEVRGAPAIGIAAAYALALGAEAEPTDDIVCLRRKIAEIGGEIKEARPTAVNLFRAIDRALAAGDSYCGKFTEEFRTVLWTEGDAILREDVEMCDAIGKYGAELLEDNCSVLTHCNAGALATGGIGTALAVIYKAVESGKKIRVYVDETRPLLQGARLTCWELKQNGIDVTLLTDNMAGHLMSLGKIDVVITGADRITGNGDVANKIGTYSIAVLAKEHGIPFYIAAPDTTFDNKMYSGNEIVIEQRHPEEVTEGMGRRIAPEGINVFNPAFDITPRRLVTAYITDSGIRDGGRRSK